MITEQVKQELLRFIEYLLNEGALADWMVDEDLEGWVDNYGLQSLPIQIHP